MNSNLVYKGNVEIKTLYKGKEIKSNIYHNKGCLPLFKYIVDCLAGNSSIVGGDRPSSIRLFNVEGESFPSPVQEGNIRDYLPTACTDVQVTTEGTSATVKYTFLVAGANVMNTDANLVALYSSSSSVSDLDNPSAWVKLSDENPLVGTSVAAGISYVIIWTMTVKDVNN